MAEKAIDLSHHLSEVSKARNTSPLKKLAKYKGQPGLISLAGGWPHPSYFPISAIHVDSLVTDSFAIHPPKERSSSFSWLWNIFSSKEKTIPFTVPKYPLNPADVNLASALQYGSAEGMNQLRDILTEFTGKVYQPAYSNWETLCHIGNTDGWSRAVQTFCNPGEYILAEEWTYPSALASAIPLGTKAIPVAVDGEGMRSDDLRKILAEWDESGRGAKRPHVMYTIPVGQNPTGRTMGLERKKEIYDICIEYDVIIIEDDPYYFLQMPDYVPKAARDVSSGLSHLSDADKYLASLVPSYVKIDYQGRVIRLDTFSKTIAPGCRLGWFTCNPLFAERLLRQGETSAQAPCGLSVNVNLSVPPVRLSWSQAIVTQLLITWKYDGYIRWLQGLGREYSNRRDLTVDLLAEAFHLRLSSSRNGLWQGCDVYDAYFKHNDPNEKNAFGETRLFSFVAPTAGMFVWIKFNFDPNLVLVKHGAESLELQLWTKLAEAGVLIAPGWYFSADQEHSPDLETEGHYRISFSTAEHSDMKKAVEIFAEVSRAFMQEISQ